MKFPLLFAFYFLLSLQNTSAQIRQPDGGGSYDAFLKIEDDITPAQRKTIINMLQVNESNLRIHGLLPAQNNTLATSFQYPIRQAEGFNDNGY